MGAYKWSMRHASMILFMVSGGLFLIGFGQAVLALKNFGSGTMIGGEPIGAGLASFLVFLSGTFTALSSAAIPFLGAVIIERWDRK